MCTFLIEISVLDKFIAIPKSKKYLEGVLSRYNPNCLFCKILSQNTTPYPYVKKQKEKNHKTNITPCKKITTKQSDKRQNKPQQNKAIKGKINHKAKQSDKQQSKAIKRQNKSKYKAINNKVKQTKKIFLFNCKKTIAIPF